MEQDDDETVKDVLKLSLGLIVNGKPPSEYVVDFFQIEISILGLNVASRVPGELTNPLRVKALGVYVVV